MDYLKEAIEKFGNDYRIASEGQEAVFHCPFCLNKRGKPDKDGKLYACIGERNRHAGYFFCFKCETKGRFVNDNRISIVEYLNDLFNKPSVKKDVSKKSDEGLQFYIGKQKIEKGTYPYEYLIKRNITEEMMDYYGLRLGTKINDLEGRIIIPNELTDINGLWTNMYQARSYQNKNPKYKNPEGVNKSDFVFNLHRQQEGGDIIIVEGAITAIVGGKNCVAVYGSHPSDEQIQKILSKNPKSITCCLDNDYAGQTGQLQLLDKLNSQKQEFDLYRVELPKGLDAADIGTELFQKFVYLSRRKFIKNKVYDFLNFESIKRKNEEELKEMAFNLEEALKKVSEEKKNMESNSSQRENYEAPLYPLVYTGAKGKITFRLLPNKTNIIFREVAQHKYTFEGQRRDGSTYSGSRRVACAQKQYGANCPVCEKIAELESIYGKEHPAYADFGSKNRGIAYVKLVDFSPSYNEGRTTPLQKGQVVLLQFPQTIYRKLVNIVEENAASAADILLNNEGYPITIEKGDGQGAEMYNANINIGKVKCFEDTPEKTGQEQYDELINETLPELTSAINPETMNDEILDGLNNVVKEMNKKYNLNKSSYQEIPYEEPKQETVQQVPVNNVQEQPVQAPVSNTVATPVETPQPVQSAPVVESVVPEKSEDGKPTCFKKEHDDSKKACLLCPYEDECIG